MKILTQWLREFVDVPADNRQMARDLTMAGLAIDAVETAANGETVFDGDIGGNRPDAMNHYGVARELSVIYDRDLQPYRPGVKEISRRASSAATIEIVDADLCPRYSARVVEGVKIGPSPDWMVRRLEASGSRSVNNVADVTNYVMLEMGQPLHAFDLDKLAGHKIVVRTARPGERLKMLDGAEHAFAAEHLVICDAEKPVAIAGVMGGLDSGISERTTRVLIESAWFDPRSVRRTARHFGMRTEASHRFERGTDIALTPTAADRAAELVRELAGGEVLAGVLDDYPNPRQRAAIELRRYELDRILGLAAPAADVLRILRRLGFRADELGYGRWSMVPPTYRLDVEREIDLIEEVGRHYGLEKFPDRLLAWAGKAVRTPSWTMERAARETARALGYDENISITLTSAAVAAPYSSAPPVALTNPLGEEAAVLRNSLVPGVASSIEWNLNRGVEDARIFEVGSVYRAAESGFEEPVMLGMAASGIDFLDLKGDVETILDLFVHKTLTFEAETGLGYFQSGRAARAVMDGEPVGAFGELQKDARRPILAAEIQLGRLFAKGLRRPAFEALPRFPAVDRDFSLLLPEGTVFGQIEVAIRALGLADLREITAVEIFRGGQVPEGRYSLLLRVRFQSNERTLADAEVNQSAATIVAALEKNFNAVLRT